MFLDCLSKREAVKFWFVAFPYMYILLQLCEIDLSDMLPAEALIPFMDEIKNREKQRNRLARKVWPSYFTHPLLSTPFVPL